ncbi:MAG: MBL fold metallo-hydrolase, partial [Alphaproteobacteria bacterium]|nr:MBL fold metallo-hydrolase [Alphaproteobacteria bacterium]
MTATDTTVDEIADGIYRISTPVPPSTFPGGFSYNQYLIADDEPLLFHTGHRRLFEVTSEAIGRVLPVESLRWLSFSHLEADECGALNQFLAAAPNAEPVCGRVAAQVSISDYADREPRALADGEALPLGKHTVRWFDAPHLPHNWECGYMMEDATATLLCGDLFTQPGDANPALTEDDILGPAEAMRQALDYYAHAANSGETLGRLAALEP